MNILSFDTSGNFLSTSVKSGNEFFEENRSSGLRHSEHLLPSVDRLMNEAGLSYGELDLIVCSKGPGSFTGLRIGMSTAKGIASGSGKPVVSVNSLDAYSYGFDFFDGPVVPLLDARKKRFYSAIYRNGKRDSDFLDISSSDLVSLLDNEQKVLFTGPGCGLFREETAAASEKHPFETFYYETTGGISGVMAILGKRILESEGPDPDNAGPLYIRLSDAELGRK